MIRLRNSEVFQHTAARRRLPGHRCRQRLPVGFNTQPPEGGCRPAQRPLLLGVCFNTQPPEGGCR